LFFLPVLSYFLSWASEDMGHSFFLAVAAWAEIREAIEFVVLFISVNDALSKFTIT
jgi:hypothetical protein